jgi:competence protein ComK
MCESQIELFEEYEINPLTMAVLPVNDNDKLYSKIYQINGEIIYSPLKPIKLIKHSCLSYCSSYEGRVAGSKKLTGSSHKVPIIIDSMNMMYFFPSASPTNSNCAWISYEYVKNYRKVDKKSTEVFFQNNQTVVVDLSYYSFEKQMMRTATLCTKLTQKIEEYEQRSILLHNYLKASESRTIYNKRNLGK